jgi:microcystin degradation protein MlrC
VATLDQALRRDPDGREALGLVRGPIDPIELHPAAGGGGFEVELVGEIAAMIRLALSQQEKRAQLGRQGADPDLFVRSVTVVADAVAHASAGQDIPDKPLVIADVTDNPGSGHYGDTTDLLRAMVEADLRNAAFYAIYDPQAVQDAIRLGVGQTGALTFGGRHDPTAGGGPLTLTGRVVAITDGRFQCFGPMAGGVWRDYGPSPLFRVGDVDIMMITNNGQATDLGQITSFGVDPTQKSTIAVKSNHHFRAAFAPVARKIITVDGGGLGAAILRGGNYTKVRRPIWPLDHVS